MMVPLTAGFLAGIKMQNRLSETQFNQVILVLVGATALGLIWQGAVKLWF
jgi:uncharacterized membrane protein YfcA